MDADDQHPDLTVSEELSFAEHAILAIDRAQRQLDVLHDQMRGADEYLRRVMLGDPAVNAAPTRVRVLNKHVQSIGVSVTRLPSGEIGVIVTHRGAEEPGHLLVPNEIYDEEVPA